MVSWISYIYTILYIFFYLFYNKICCLFIFIYSISFFFFFWHSLSTEKTQPSCPCGLFCQYSTYFILLAFLNIFNQYFCSTYLASLPSPASRIGELDEETYQIHHLFEKKIAYNAQVPIFLHLCLLQILFFKGKPTLLLLFESHKFLWQPRQ